MLDEETLDLLNQHAAVRNARIVALEDEYMRLKEKFDRLKEAADILARGNERLHKYDDVILAARSTVGAAHSRGNDIEVGLVSGLYDALRRAGLEPIEHRRR